jgi:hypothetical protein
MQLMIIKTQKNLLSSLLLLFIAIPFSTTAQNKIVLQFENMVGEKLLQQDSVYMNAFGETFTVRSLKYYISKIVLQNDDKTQSFPDQYFLVNDEDSSSKQIELTTTLNRIIELHFLLGVDSLKNVSGVQTGNLDPAKGMFWTWNTGYVMAKLEGNSPSANMPQHAFSYHVGGYKQNENTAREIYLTLPHAVNCGNTCTITVSANVLSWFNAAHEIKIATTPFCHEPGLLATKLADNYANMFTIGLK